MIHCFKKNMKNTSPLGDATWMPSVNKNYTKNIHCKKK